MRTISAGKLVLASCIGLAASSALWQQQPPKTDHAGNSVCIVRNESTAVAIIEYRSNNQWQQVRLEPASDANIAGDRVRVATTRDDKSIVTVDLPVQAGKKYRLVWNIQASIWDFSPAS